jgi:ATP-dependent Clp protease protease subunit
MKDKFNEVSPEAVQQIVNKALSNGANQKRVILVKGEVNADMAGVINAQLRSFEDQDPTTPITMIINSPGGNIIDGLSIYDTMRGIQNKIITVGVGMQASMGSVILVGGDERYMSPNSQLLVHQGSGGAEGTPTEVAINEALSGRLRDILKNIYQDQTGLTREYWGTIMEHDTWFTAKQAKEIGFIQGIQDFPQAKQSHYAQDRANAVEYDANANALVASIAGDESKLALALNSPASDPTGTAFHSRPELATALAKFPEFWTATKKAELEKAAQATALSNDNNNVHKARAPKPAALPH